MLKLFSERQKQLRGEVPDVYQYDTIPRELRVQVIHLWEAAVGKLTRNYPDDCYPISVGRVYEYIHKSLCYHYGEFSLGGSHDSDFDSVCSFLLHTEDTERAIDVIELSFQYIDEYVRNNLNQFSGREIEPERAINALNYWFRERGVGYQYESGQIIRVDSEFIHSEVVKPTLGMLSDPMYEGADDEFRKAHEHYRVQRYAECMNECLKAFESCIKAICDKRGWSYGNKNGLKDLIDIVYREGLVPSAMQSYFSGLRSTLESGASTLRNRRSGHGQGSKIITVPEHMAAYVLHLTASNILFLAKANEEMR